MKKPAVKAGFSYRYVGDMPGMSGPASQFCGVFQGMLENSSSSSYTPLSDAQPHSIMTAAAAMSPIEILYLVFIGLKDTRPPCRNADLRSGKSSIITQGHGIGPGYKPDFPVRPQ